MRETTYKPRRKIVMVRAKRLDGGKRRQGTEILLGEPLVFSPREHSFDLIRCWGENWQEINDSQVGKCGKSQKIFNSTHPNITQLEKFFICTGTSNSCPIPLCEGIFACCYGNSPHTFTSSALQGSSLLHAAAFKLLSLSVLWNWPGSCHFIIFLMS